MLSTVAAVMATLSPVLGSPGDSAPELDCARHSMAWVARRAGRTSRIPTSNSSYGNSIPEIAPAASGRSGLSSCSSWSAASSGASPKAFRPCCGYCHTRTKRDATVSTRRGDAG